MKSKQIALCGLLCALAVTMLLLGGILGIGMFAGPILAMAVLLPILEEYGAKTAAAACGCCRCCWPPAWATGPRRCCWRRTGRWP